MNFYSPVVCCMIISEQIKFMVKFAHIHMYIKCMLIHLSCCKCSQWWYYSTFNTMCSTPLLLASCSLELLSYSGTCLQNPQNLKHCRLSLLHVNHLSLVSYTVVCSYIVCANDIDSLFLFQPPAVTCQTKIWHPNIDETGAVCLSILRSTSLDGTGWAPTRTLKDVVWGVYALFGVSMQSYMIPPNLQRSWLHFAFVFPRLCFGIPFMFSKIKSLFEMHASVCLCLYLAVIDMHCAWLELDPCHTSWDK